MSTASKALIPDGHFRGGGNLTHPTGGLVKILNDMKAGLAEATAGEVIYFVSDVNGLDTNDGLTAATAFKSLQKVLDELPLTLSHVTRVRVGKHSGTGYPLRAVDGGMKKHVYDANLIIHGDGAGQAGEDGFTDVVANFVSGAASDVDAIVTTGLTIDAHIGHTMECTLGANLGMRRTIAGNSATVVTFLRDFPNAVVAETDEFKIVRPEVHIDVGDAEQIWLRGTPYSIGDRLLTKVETLNLVNLAFVSGFNADAELMLSGRIHCYGVEIAEGALEPDASGAWFMGAGVDEQGATGFEAHLPVDMGLATDVEAWRGWGVAAHLTGSFLGSLILNDGMGYLAGSSLEVGGPGRVTLLGSRLVGEGAGSKSTIIASAGGQVFVAGGAEDHHKYTQTHVDRFVFLADLGGLIRMSGSASEVVADHIGNKSLVRAKLGGMIYILANGSIAFVDPTPGMMLDASRGGKIYIVGVPAVGELPGDANVAVIEAGVDIVATFAADGAALFAAGSLIQRDDT